MKEAWRHKKRGSVYEVVTQAASIQVSAAPDIEERYGHVPWTVYRSIETGLLYLRPTEEFLDGRFERIEITAADGDADRA